MKKREIPSNSSLAVRILSIAFALAISIVWLTYPAEAVSIQNSELFKGAMALLKDCMVAAVILCPVLGGLAAVVCLGRRSMADDQDGKAWTKRACTAIICGVGGSLVSSVIALVSSYFGG